MRLLEVSVTADGKENLLLNGIQFSNVAKAADWILDLNPLATNQGDGVDDEIGVCAAVTAHNALLELTIRRNFREDASQR